MDGYSSSVPVSPSSGYGAESVLGQDSDYGSDHHIYQDHHVLPDSDLSDSESEGGLFVDQERSVSPASVITLSASEQEDDHQIAPYNWPPPPAGLEQGLYLDRDDDDFDFGLQSEIERELAQSDIDVISSDSEGTVGQEPSDSPEPLHIIDPHHPFQANDFREDSDESQELDQEDYDFDDDLFGGDFGDSEEDDIDQEDYNDADFLGLPEPVPHHHHHHHLHHHHFHHPRLAAVHADRHSPIVLGVNPLQHLGPHLNFLPPHLHEHLRRASSSPGLPGSRGMPRMDELVGVEMGGRGSPAIGGNVRGRSAHNQNQQPRSQPNPNVIDLTLDDEEVEIVSGSQNARRQQSQRRNNAPRLNRSDGSYVGNQNIIELSSDSEDEVQINRVSSAAPLPANHHRHHHHHIHHHHAPHHHHHRGAMDRRSPRRMHGANNARVDANNGGMLNMVGNLFGRIIGGRVRNDEVVMLGSSPPAILPIPNIPNIGQIHLDYVAHPFHPPAPPPGPQKPPHEAPPPARDGFTRDTNEDAVLICPSCDEELAFDPDDEDENGPPTKKARTKKDKAEHHFWAVKECGHVSFAQWCSFSSISILLTAVSGLLQEMLRKPQTHS